MPFKDLKAATTHKKWHILGQHRVDVYQLNLARKILYFILLYLTLKSSI